MKHRVLGLDKETKQEWETTIQIFTRNRKQFGEDIEKQIESLCEKIHEITEDIRFARTKREQIYLQKIGVTLISYKNRLKRLLRP